MSKTILTKNPGILVLITGKDYYDSIITTALEYSWKVETWFWNSGMVLFIIYI